VDAVVEVVFERLRNAATTQNATRSLPPSRKATRLNLPLPKQRTALAEALADLLLADLASVARTRPRVRGTRRARPPTKRGTAPPKTRRARP
jgi:hypothetical protein